MNLTLGGTIHSLKQMTILFACEKVPRGQLGHLTLLTYHSHQSKLAFLSILYCSNKLSRAHTPHLHLHPAVHLSALCSSMCMLVDDLYLLIILACAHEQKRHRVHMTNKNAVFVTLMGLTNLFKA